MRMVDCLNYADIDTLRRVAEHYKFNCTLHSKLSLYQEIAYNFRIRSFLSEQIPSWFQGRETGLLRLCFEANRPYTQEELQAWLTSTDDIDKAVAEGWLFPTSRLPDSRNLYCVPDELRQAIAEYVLKRFRKQLDITSESPLLYADEENLLQQDLDVFLEYVRNHETTLTQDGTMYKRHLIRILDMMQISEQPLTGGWRFGYGRRFHDYPDRFSLIYDFAFADGLINERETGVLEVTPNSDKWVQADPVERNRRLVHYYLSSYRRAILRLPVIVRLLAMNKDVWVRESSMFTATGHLLNDYYYDSTLDVWEQRVLKMIQHLGLIRRGEDESGTKWFQTTNIGQQLLSTGEIPEAASNATNQKILIVQPNFNILATADQPSVTAQLSKIAVLRETGAVRVYRLNEQSFCRGLEENYASEAWIEFLQSHSQTPIPGNVEKTLLDWGQKQVAEHNSLTS